MASERITVATVCDNHYIVMLAALIKSIEFNYKGNERIDLYIISDQIKKRNRIRLINSVDQEKINLKWLDINEIVPNNIQLPFDQTFFPANIYARLFIADWLSEQVERILYLDVDMIFRKDISPLWHTNIEGKTIGAVIDKSMTVASSWAGIRNYKELDLESDTKYFNSGLMIIDAVKWHHSRSTEHVLQRINDNLEHAHYPDQYGLNVVFAKQWFELDTNWNCQSGIESKNPFVIHFTGRKPIYKSYSASRDYNPAYKEEFYHYLRLTEWSGFKGFTEFERVLKKLGIRLRKIAVNLQHRFNSKFQGQI